MPVTGQALIAKNIIKYGDGFVKSVNRIMGDVRKVLDTEVTKNMSLSDHGPADFRSLGYPYARKHGAQGKSLHDPYWLVHTQTGKLLQSKSSGVEEANINAGTLKASAFVKLDAGIAKHALFVVLGTSKMIPRPVLEGSKNIVAPQARSIIGKLKDLKVLT